MEVSEFERAAMHGKPMPANLLAAEQVKYIGLLCLYWGVRQGVFSRQQGSEYKRRLLKALDGFDANREKERRLWEDSTERTLQVDRACQKYLKSRTMENADALAGALEWLHEECAELVKDSKCPNCGHYFDTERMHRKPNFCEECGCALKWGEERL